MNLKPIIRQFAIRYIQIVQLSYRLLTVHKLTYLITVENCVFSSNRVILSTNKGPYRHQCYLVMNLTYLFWYMLHVEQILRNGNGIRTDLIEDTLENDYR
jgi:hypothetical protein